MRHDKYVLGTLALVLVLVLGACSKKAQPEPPAPAPVEEAKAAEDDGRAAREAAERAERERLERERARAALMELVHFDFDQFAIRSDSRATLEAKIPYLRQDPSIRLRIEGHADERGSDEYNLALGLRRASAVKEFLVGYGLDGSRFETASLGEDRPLDPASNEAAWAKNRRAEFQILSGRLIGND